MGKPLIMVTNDDGITAPGILALIDEMQDLGEVLVVAPDSPQSGMGHAITINSTLRLREVPIMNGITGYSCTGTPVDCVKMAVNEILKKKPDLLVSGINHGPNNSINVIYSGTMSAAIEGALERIPSIGLSLMTHDINADFSAARKYARQSAKLVLENGLPEGVCLNVNIPNLHADEIMGVKVCRQADANWQEEFVVRKDPSGEEYYWMTGYFQNFDEGTDTDVWALDNNYVSVVPTQYDLTAHTAIGNLQQWDFHV